MNSTVREDILHYIWQVKGFDYQNLKTTTGQSVEVKSFGFHNQDAGPDFLNARIEIDGILWAGHIEMHINASDWGKHNHQIDEKYESVILHVVLNDDVIVKSADGRPIPTLAIKNRIDKRLVSHYQVLRASKSWVPCQQMIADVDSMTVSSTKERMLADRLERKSVDLRAQLESLDNNLSELIYQRFAYAFGLRVNADSFLRLAESIPYSIIQKHRDSLFQLEALLFGQSGLLDGVSNDEYVQRLLKEYTFFRSKFDLMPLRKTMWSFLRMRPAAFPTVRIAQFAKLLHTVPRLENLLLDSSIEELQNSLKISVDGYWSNHYVFGEVSVKRKKSVGRSKRDVVAINVMAPIVYTYGVIRDSQEYRDRAIELLKITDAESNSIITKWKEMGVDVENAADTQGLINLKRNYCDTFQCLRCQIGHRILKSSQMISPK